MEHAVLVDSFDGEYFAAGHINRQGRAALDRSPVQKDHAGAALARVAAHVRAGEAEGLAEEIDEQRAGLDFS